MIIRTLRSDTSFKVNQDVNNTVMMKLFNFNGKWKVEDANNNNRHEINLYSNADPIDPPDKEHYNIIYNGNGATSGTVGDQTITYDKWTQSISSNSYKKNGKNPDANWNTKPDGSGTSIKAGTKIRM